MNIQRHIARITVLLATLLMLNACSDEHTNEYFADNSHTLLRVSLSHFSTEGQAQPVSGETRIERMDAYLFEDGILTEYHPQLIAESENSYKLDLQRRAGALYVLANAETGLVPEIGLLTEVDFCQQTLTVADGHVQPFLTGQIKLTGQAVSSIPLTLKHGTARLDFRIRVAGSFSVHQFGVRSAAKQTFVLPQTDIQTPPGAEKEDILLTFDQGLKQDSAAIMYLYEQANPDLKVYVKAEMDGTTYEMEQPLPEVLKRNTIYTITLRKDLSGAHLVVEEWAKGEDTELIPSLDSRLTVDRSASQLPDDVQVADGGSTLIFPHNATEVLLAVDCDDELEMLPLEGYPLTVEPVTQTRGIAGKNLFRIRKLLYPPGHASDEACLQFHRKGLDNSYPEDHIRLVLQANPTQMEGLLDFDLQNYTHCFDHYIDNELATITLPEGKEIFAEFNEGEDPWMKIAPQEEGSNVYRVLAGWKPNDPTANGRVQEARIVIRNKADGSAREAYTVSRRNYGLPVTWLHGVWWCKYNARGNSKSFDDQILSSDDPAVKVGTTVFNYLRDCTIDEFYDLWGWAYQGGRTQGMQVVVQDSVAVLDGFTTSGNTHMNKLEPTTLAPDGYEVPSMEEFNRMFDATDYIWVMWNGTHTLKNPWEGHSKIQREQRRRNDLVIDELALSDLIYIAMKSPEFTQYEPVVWYGPSAQWNTSGIYHGHYNNILFTVYSPTGSGWYFNGSMAGLYLTQNGAGVHDTRILRFKKSPVEYIYGEE